VEGIRSALYVAIDAARNRHSFKLNNSNPLGFTAGHKESEGVA
jgi:hypothetical protein